MLAKIKFIEKQKEANCLSKTVDIIDVKKKYRNLFYELRNIINQYDPIHIFYEGFNPDEYEPEVSTIIIQLKEEQSQKEVHALVYKEFQRWFEPVAGKKEEYSELASAIHKWLAGIELP